VAELRILVSSTDGKAAAEVYDEFEPLELPWKPPGYMPRWVDRDNRVFPTRVRQGWRPADVEKDFRAKGCPENLLPQVVQPGGEIHFGDSILCLMPVELARKRYQAMVSKTQMSRRAAIERAEMEGERLAHHLRARGFPRIGKNIVLSAKEAEAGDDENYSVRTRDGQRYGDGGPDRGRR